jgi:ribosomal protein S18 acetylase RimI-like enzyme
LLYVDEEFRGQGWGRKLLDEMKNYFAQNNCDSMRLLTLSGNASTIKIYEKYGFKVHEAEMRLRIER